jgi:hypothetical protein
MPDPWSAQLMATAMDGTGVKVVGLRELRRELKAKDAGLPKELRLITKSVGDDLVPDLRRAAQSDSPQMAKGARSIMSGATARGAYIRLGGAKAPWLKGSEFGSKKFRQFRDWRGNGTDGGYAISPELRRQKGHIAATAERRISSFLERTE